MHTTSTYALQDRPQGTTSRRVDRVKAHVNKHWIPINQELAAKIVEGIEEGIYDLDVDFLIAELRNDIGLLLYCMRELAAKLSKASVSRMSIANPFEIIRRAGLHQLKEVLTRSVMNGCRHSYDTSTEFQTERAGEMMVAASAVEVMAENTELDAEVGFSVSLLRQLGMALIAWNYPGLYERAMNGAHEGKDPIDLITMELGISPSLLSVKVINDWGLSSEVGEMISPGKSDDIGTSMLKSLCEAGEALARANNPKRYPEARKDWEFSRAFLQDLIGDDAMSMVRRKVKENSSVLYQLMPTRFQRVAEFNPDAIIHDDEEERRLFRNPYAKDCSYVLRTKFKELYSRLSSGGVDRKNVAFLINQIIPAAGFSGGVIYIINPASMKLMPQMVFGKLFLTSARPIRVGADVMNNHPVQLAFSSWDVVDGVNASSEAISHNFITGTIGTEKKAGVLYLERETETSGISDLNHKANFQAILHALNEVLALNS